MNGFNLEEQFYPNTNFNAMSEKVQKFNALKTKILKEFTSEKNLHFKQYLNKLSQQISQKNDSRTHQKGISLSRTKSKQKKRAIDQLQLPFQVYIYTSNDSQAQSYEEVPFHISDSSISGLSEENQENLKIQKRMEKLQNRVFSFAKQKRQFLQYGNEKSNKILGELNEDNKTSNKEFGILEKLVSKQFVNKIVDSQLQKYMKMVDSKVQQTFSDSSQDQQQFQNQIETSKQINLQLQVILSPYLESAMNQVTNKIRENYFSSIYLPSELQSLDQRLYLKQQQWEIKKNQLQTLSSLLQQIKNNKKVQSVIQQNHIKLSTSQKQPSNITNNKPQNNNKSKKNILVPLLNLQSLNQQVTHKSREQKALTSKRKQNQQTDRSHQLEKVSSKAGRRYFYDKDNQSLSRKNLTQNRSSKRGQRENNLNQIKENRNGKVEYENQQQIRHENHDKEKKYDFRKLMNEKQPPNSIHPKDAKNEQLKPQQKVASPQMTEHQSKLHLKQIQLQQEYKKNLREVLTFQIDHLKTQLDLINQHLSTLITQNQHKYLRIQVIDQVNSLKIKKNHVKNKLKTKIKQFWTISQLSPFAKTQ